jgi:hypothetical protein
MSISAVKFSPDGTLLASCGLCEKFAVLLILDKMAQVRKRWSKYGRHLQANS